MVFSEDMLIISVIFKPKTQEAVAMAMNLYRFMLKIHLIMTII